jgi:hypothetical protein
LSDVLLLAEEAEGAKAEADATRDAAARTQAVFMVNRCVVFVLLRVGVVGKGTTRTGRRDFAVIGSS